jgi:peptide/nickel transport system permease protein
MITALHRSVDPASDTFQAMVQSLVRRSLAGLAVVIGVVTLMFFLIRLAPGDPALLLVGPGASQEQLAAQRKTLGLDRSLPRQYAAWLNQFVRGDWGTSIATGRPVRAMISTAWPATVRLVGLSLVLSYLLGIVVGAVQAARGGSLDTGLSVVTVTLFALPGYWLGLMLVMVFTYWARALPAFGAAGFDADFLTGWDRVFDGLRHLALPLATLTLIGVGGTARFVRGAMLDVRGAPHVAIARAKGLSPAQVIVRHVLRNALIPVLTLLGLSLPALFSGAVFIEAIFAWPGVGRVMVEAVGARDYPVVMAATAVSAALVVLGNLLAEVLAAWADPRLRTRQPPTGPA